jgi:hypothetical protein
MKQLLFLTVYLFLNIGLKSQDTIYFKNGDTLNVRVKEVKDEEIKYTMPNTEEPIFFVNTSKLIKVTFNNGKYEKIYSNSKFKPLNITKNNVVYLEFIQSMSRGQINIEYERYIGSKYLSLSIPVRYKFFDNINTNRFNNKDFYQKYGIGARVNAYTDANSRVIFYFGLGLEIGFYNALAYEYNNYNLGQNGELTFDETPVTINLLYNEYNTTIGLQNNISNRFVFSYEAFLGLLTIEENADYYVKNFNENRGNVIGGMKMKLGFRF